MVRWIQVMGQEFLQAWLWIELPCCFSFQHCCYVGNECRSIESALARPFLKLNIDVLLQAKSTELNLFVTEWRWYLDFLAVDSMLLAFECALVTILQDEVRSIFEFNDFKDRVMLAVILDFLHPCEKLSFLLFHCLAFLLVSVSIDCLLLKLPVDWTCL